VATDSLTERPVFEASIAESSGPDTAQVQDSTDDDGRFAIRNIPLRSYTFTASHPTFFDKPKIYASLNPRRDSIHRRIAMIPQSLTLTCGPQSNQYHSRVREATREMPDAVRLTTLDVRASQDTLRIWPVISNNVDLFPVFVPDNFNFYGHYRVDVINQEGDTLDVTFANRPERFLSEHRIYRKPDVIPVPPQTTRELEPLVLTFNDTPEDETLIQAQVTYNFTLEETIRPTQNTPFPEVDIDRPNRGFEPDSQRLARPLEERLDTYGPIVGGVALDSTVVGSIVFKNGYYDPKWIEAWREAQSRNLSTVYCDLYRRRLRTEPRTTRVRADQSAQRASAAGGAATGGAAPSGGGR
jgi:hypothetical protein